jgi:penicillin-binding protein 1C
VVSGGSTLTMQVARMLEPTPHTVPGKLRQVARALQLELRLSKREILELYLTFAPMGGVLEGVEAASRAYLGKPAQRLTAAEAALLAVLPQAPSRCDRTATRSARGLARDKVLERMESRWGAATVADARQEPVIAQTVREPLLAPLFAERLRRCIRRGKDRQHARRRHAADRRAAAVGPPGGAATARLDGRAGGRQRHAGSARLRRLGRFCRRRALRARRHGTGGALAGFGTEALALRTGARRGADPFRVAAGRRAAIVLRVTSRAISRPTSVVRSAPRKPCRNR